MSDVNTTFADEWSSVVSNEGALHVMPTEDAVVAMEKGEFSYDNTVRDLLGQLVTLRKTSDEVEQKENQIKSELEKIMLEHNVESVESDRFDNFISASLIKGSESESLDLKKFQKDCPVEYAQLFVKYKKVTVKKPYLRIMIKAKTVQ